MEKQNFDEYRIRNLKNKISGISEDIKKRRNETRKSIADYRNKQREIGANYKKSIEMETAFREIAKNCNPEWFGPNWIHPLNENVNKFNHINFFCS